MFAYKGFQRGLICLGYQFVLGKNVTEKANCGQNGFHCAENPLDCLSYYSDIGLSDYCLVIPGGDVDEDQIDSKISCTELTIVKKLTIQEFFLHGLAYMVDHPIRKWSRHVQRNYGEATGGYCVVRGHNPVARGPKGSILALAKDDLSMGKITQIALTRVDGKKIRANTWYDIDWKERDGA